MNLEPGPDMDAEVARVIFGCKVVKHPNERYTLGYYYSCECMHQAGYHTHEHGLPEPNDDVLAEYSTDPRRAVDVVLQMHGLGYPYRIEAGNVHVGTAYVCFESAFGKWFDGRGQLAEAICRAALAARHFIESGA